MTPEQDRDVAIQAVIDLRRAFDVLLNQPNVDSKRIAYVGHSYGAQWGAILTAIDRRMIGSVLIAGTPSYAAVYLEGQAPELVEIRKQAGMDAMKKEEAVMNQLDAIRYVPYSAPIPLLFQFAKYEQFFSIPAMQSYADATHSPKQVRWYSTGHELNDIDALVDRAAWLSEQLRSPKIREAVRSRVKSVSLFHEGFRLTH